MHDLTVIFQHYGRPSFREIAGTPGTLAMADGSAVHNVYMTFDRPAMWMVKGGRTAPPRGWLDIDVPHEVGGILFLSQMEAVSEWWDEEKRPVDNPESLLLFRQVARLFRKRLKRPVWIYSTAVGGEPSVTRDIWYSEGAAEWMRGGGQLRQVGSGRDRPTISRFLIEKPDSPILRPTPQTLIQEFLECPEQSLKWSLGHALSLVADDSVFEQVVEIARDRRYGTARQTVAGALGRMRDPRAAEVLIELLGDEQVAGYAITALGKLGAVQARPDIERFLAHEDELVRTRAKQAIADIDKRK